MCLVVVWCRICTKSVSILFYFLCSHLVLFFPSSVTMWQCIIYSFYLPFTVLTQSFTENNLIIECLVNWYFGTEDSKIPMFLTEWLIILRLILISFLRNSFVCFKFWIILFNEELKMSTSKVCFHETLIYLIIL